MGGVQRPNDAGGGTDMAAHLKGSEHRRPDHPIEPIFVDRWSPRAMSGEPIDEGELMRLFEAARWAPSTYNEQEWRFLYARRDSPHWPAFFGLLMEANQAWCDKAAVLMVVLSHKVFTHNGRPNPVHTFDAGAAFENLALAGGRDGPGRPRHGGLRPGQGAGDARGCPTTTRSRRWSRSATRATRRAAAQAPGARGPLEPQARRRDRPRGAVRVLAVARRNLPAAGAWYSRTQPERRGPSWDSQTHRPRTVRSAPC